MKKLLLVCVLLVSTMAVFSQVKIDTLMNKAAYCEIVGTSGFFSKKLTITLDFGQDQGGLFNPKDSRLKSEDGENIKFNSMIDALNTMETEGWSFITAYIIGDAKSGYVYHWLLKRKN